MWGRKVKKTCSGYVEVLTGFETVITCPVPNKSNANSLSTQFFIVITHV